MTAILKRLALPITLAFASFTIFAQSGSSSNVVREPETWRGVSVQNASYHKTKDDDKKQAQDGEYWFSRGYALHQSDHYIEAISAFTKAIGLRYRQATSMYNVACGYALLNDKENALFWLDRSLVVGFDRVDLLRSDSDLDSLRSDARFTAIVQKVSLMKHEDKPGKDKATSRLEEAINTFEQMRRDSSRDGDAWYTIGSRLLRLRELDRAATALNQAVEHLPYSGSNAMYNLACTYSLSGDRAQGLEWLEKSINAGFDDSDKLRNDPDIANLRGEARFKSIQELSRVLSMSQFNSNSGDDSQYSKERWAPAVKTYEAFVREHPTNGRAWFNLGYALHYSREHTRAIDAFHHAIQVDYRKPTSEYNIACGYSMMNNRDAAFEWLDKSVSDGFDIEGYVNNDEDLDNLRSDQRFRKFSLMAEDTHKNKDKNKEKDKDKDKDQ